MKGNVVSARSHATGKRYFEIELVSDEGPLTQIYFGVTRSNPPGEFDGIDISASWSGNVYVDFSYTGEYAGEYAAGDVVRVAIDFNESTPDSVKVWFAVNGGAWVNDGDPVTGSGQAGVTSPWLLAYSGTYYAAAQCNRHSEFTDAFAVRLNAQASQFAYAVPSGFLPWET